MNQSKGVHDEWMRWGKLIRGLVDEAPGKTHLKA